MIEEEIHAAVASPDGVLAAGTLPDLLATGRAIWGGRRMSLPEASTVLAVVVGDLARQARAASEGQAADLHEVGKELGNLVLTAVRAADDLGLDPAECVAAAEDAQRAYLAASDAAKAEEAP